MTDTEKAERNRRVQERWDALCREGRHGHYETLFRVVREEVERESAPLLTMLSRVSHLNSFRELNDILPEVRATIAKATT